jgi:hypothetical protein
MRRVLPVLVAGLVWALPSAASAQVPRQDSVSLSGTAITTNFTVNALNAMSGPSGENPSGQAAFLVFGSISISGPVTCLAVNGNTATLNVQDAGFGVVTVQVTDNQPDTFVAAPTGITEGRLPTDCSPLAPTSLNGPVSGGDITVVDAPPLPASKDQCKNGGWKNFPGFKNQGQCVSFVAMGGKNPPVGS